MFFIFFFFFFQAEDGIRDLTVTGVQTCALPISSTKHRPSHSATHTATTPSVTGTCHHVDVLRSGGQTEGGCAVPQWSPRSRRRSLCKECGHCARALRTGPPGGTAARGPNPAIHDHERWRPEHVEAEPDATERS